MASSRFQICMPFSSFRDLKLKENYVNQKFKTLNSVNTNNVSPNLFAL